MSGNVAIYEFGEFQFEPRNGRLSRSGVLLHAEPKALLVLEVLLEHRGSLVDRDTLFDRVWGRVIVSTGTLTRLIADLRKLLGDHAGKPRYIVTVHTKGYRWIAPLARTAPPLRRAAPPAPTIRLIGRDSDIAKLTLLAATERLITLAGPCGTGKTQLALEFARRRERLRPNTVVWIDLTAAGDTRALQALIASGLDLQVPATVDFALGVAQAVGDRAVMLVLDNCEQFAGNLAPLVRMLLGRCAEAAVLCTTQVTLDLPEETVYWLAPLDVPTGEWELASNPVAALLQCGAAQLLDARARAVSPSFELTRHNASSIAAICRRLDGLPLALELAAARLTILTPHQLLGALDDRFGLLSRQSSTADQRHGSLRRAIEWSYELLEPEERDLLDGFGVLCGSWSLEAALALGGGPARAAATLNGLQSLVQKSLVIVERAPGGLRYRQLESVRAFACARLAAAGTEHRVRLLHAAYFSSLAATAGDHLLENEQSEWMDLLDSEWANLRAAWEWLLLQGSLRSLAIRLLSGLRWHFWIRGTYSEALQWYGEAQALMQAGDPADQARLFNGYAITLLHAYQIADAGEYALRASGCAQAAKLVWEQAYALSVSAWLAVIAGRPEDGRRFAAEARLLNRLSNDAWIEGFSGLGVAYVHVYAREPTQALAAWRPVAESFDLAGDNHMRMFVSAQQALQSFLAEDYSGARRWALRCLECTQRIGNLRGMTGVCETTAYIAAREGHSALAASLLGAAAGGRAMTGAPLFSYWLPAHDAAWNIICESLGMTQAQQLHAAGRLAGPRDSATLAASFLRQTVPGGRGAA